MRIAIFLLPVLFAGCGKPLFRPYSCGPVLSENDIQVFREVNEYLDLGPGDYFADIGASSGYYDGAMAVFVDSVNFFVQDIDQKCLSERNLKRVIRYYSRFSNTIHTNRFRTVIGDEKRTNLPPASFDKIYSNATFHVLKHPDDIISDLYGSLKPDGLLFIRDEFTYNNEIKYCDSKNCRNLIPPFQDFMTIMERNGFKLTGQSNGVGSFPIYRFSKVPGALR